MNDIVALGISTITFIISMVLWGMLLIWIANDQSSGYGVFAMSLVLGLGTALVVFGLLT